MIASALLFCYPCCPDVFSGVPVGVGGACCCPCPDVSIGDPVGSGTIVGVGEARIVGVPSFNLDFLEPADSSSDCPVCPCCLVCSASVSEPML